MRLSIDFGPSERKERKAMLVVSAAVLCLTMAAFVFSQTNRQRASDLEQQRDRLVEQVSASAQRMPRVEPAMAGQLQHVLDRLATPWADLFGAIDQMAFSDVRLSAIEPSVQTGSVRMAGSVGSMARLRRFIAEAEATRVLSGVRLASFEQQADDMSRLDFVVTAKWRVDSPENAPANTGGAAE